MYTYYVPVPLRHLTIILPFVTITLWRGHYDLQLVDEVSGGQSGQGIFSRSYSLPVASISWLSTPPGKSWVFTESVFYCFLQGCAHYISPSLSLLLWSRKGILLSPPLPLNMEKRNWPDKEMFQYPLLKVPVVYLDPNPQKTWHFLG